MRTIWITGASSGIGEALALAYDEEQNHLILSARNADTLAGLSQRLKCTTTVIPLDVTKEYAITQAVKDVIKTTGRIDTLINSAGVSQRSLVLDTENKTGRKILEVNFFGTVHMVKAVLPQMNKQNSGEIVTISSAAGKFGFPRRSYYSASKHALHGFFDSLMAELKDSNIHILQVCPGRINTAISANALTGDGTAFNDVDKRLEKGISAEKCASIIKKGLARKKHEIYLGGQEVIMIYIKRLFPALYRRIVKKVKAY